MSNGRRMIYGAALLIALSGMACTTGRSGSATGGSSNGIDTDSSGTGTGGTMYNYTSSNRGTGTGGSHDGTSGYDTGGVLGNYTSPSRGYGAGGTYEMGPAERSRQGATMENGRAAGGSTAPSNDRMNGRSSFEGYSGAATGKSTGGSTSGW